MLDMNYLEKIYKKRFCALDLKMGRGNIRASLETDGNDRSSNAL
jgi:hypothetical protein